MIITSLFRIVYAWSTSTKINNKHSSFLNQYTTTTPKNCSPRSHLGMRCISSRVHTFYRCNAGNINSSPKIQQPYDSSRSVSRRRPLKITTTTTTTTTNSRIPLRLFASNQIIIDDDNDVTDDSDLYEYDTDDGPDGMMGNSTPWIIPSKVFIPEDRIGMKFVRSSGAGGQNVNKVSSCVQIRFHVLSAEWMGPLEVRHRFLQQYKNTISKHDGVYHMESQVYRTQSDNRKDVLKKLEAAILHVWPRPKIRKLRVGLTERGKQKRKEEKLKQSTKKEGRRNQKFDF